MESFFEFCRDVLFLSWDNYSINTIIYFVVSLIGIIMLCAGLYDVKNKMTLSGVAFTFVGVLAICIFTGDSQFVPDFVPDFLFYFALDNDIIANPVFFVFGILCILLQFYLLHDVYGEPEEE